MILWFRRTLTRQLIALFLIAAIAAGCDYFWAPTPPVRLRLELVLQGLAAGVFVSAVSQALSTALVFFSADFVLAGGELRRRFGPRSFPAVLGMLVLTAIGEEVLFRGYALSAFFSRGILAAWSVHAVLVLAANFTGRRRISWTLVRFLEANLLAYAYLESRSLAASAAARLVIEVGELVLAAPRTAFVSRFKRRRFRPLPFAGAAAE